MLVGGLVTAMVAGHLFIVTLTAQSLRSSPPLRSDRSTSTRPTTDSDGGATSTPAPFGASRLSPPAAGR